MKSFLTCRRIALSVLLAMAAGAGAAPRTWDGGGLDGFFSNALNWDGNNTAPTSNLDTLFAGANTIGAVPFIGFDTGEFRTDSFTFLATAIAPYTVTAASSSDSLTLTGTAIALQNSSPVRQRFDLITTTVGAATQTWDGGAQGLAMAQVDLGTNRTLTFTGTGTTASSRNEISGGITGLGTSGLTKSGAGTLFLNSAGGSDYTGPTTLLAGRLLLGQANQIPDASKLVLGGGTLELGGFSETAGALTLSGSATIDFGLADALALVFGDSDSELWNAGILNIINYVQGQDTLRFGIDATGLTAAQLAQIRFDGTTMATINSAGFLQPVPEPAVSATLLLGLFIAAGRRRRSKPHTAA